MVGINLRRVIIDCWPAQLLAGRPADWPKVAPLVFQLLLRLGERSFKPFDARLAGRWASCVVSAPLPSQRQTANDKLRLRQTVRVRSARPLSARRARSLWQACAGEATGRKGARANRRATGGGGPLQSRLIVASNRRHLPPTHARSVAQSADPLASGRHHPTGPGHFSFLSSSLALSL